MNCQPSIRIRLLEYGDIAAIAEAFHAIGWNKPAAQYEQYLAEQGTGQRVVLIAVQEEIFCGYLTICWQSNYPPFRSDNVPEVVDFNVLPSFRRRGIGSCLMDEAERRIALRSPMAGIGVGLYADYGAAQRLYVKRGYIPDGRGLVWKNNFVKPGSQVIADDDLVLYFTKQLSPSPTPPDKDN